MAAKRETEVRSSLPASLVSIISMAKLRSPVNTFTYTHAHTHTHTHTRTHIHILACSIACMCVLLLQLCPHVYRFDLRGVSFKTSK